MLRSTFLAVLVGAIVTAMPAAAQNVPVYPGSDGLAGALSWAKAEARSARHSVWLGFSTDRLSWDNTYFRSNDDGATLEELVYDRASANEQPDYRAAARKELDRMDGKEGRTKVRREIALLLQVGTDGEIEDVEIADMDRSTDIDRGSLRWGGKSSQRDIVEFVGRRIASESSDQVRQNLATFVGLMDEADNAMAVLKSVASTDRSEEARKQAIFWIGRRGTDDALDTVVRTIEEDRSDEVRAHAVFVLSRFDRTDTIDRLIKVARSATSEQVASQARFWSGRLISKKLFGEDDNRDEMDRVRKQALYALVGDLNESVDVLVDLANNGNSESVRRQAVFMLGQVDSPAALDALESLASRSR